MSVQAMSWVFQHSRSHLASRLVLLAIADCADDQGEKAWPHIATIARKAHVSERQAQRAIKELCVIGELRVELEAGPRRSNVYQLRMEGDNLSPSRVTNHTNKGDISGGAIRKNVLNHPKATTPPKSPPCRGGLTDRKIGRVLKAIERRKGAWIGLEGSELDRRTDDIIRGEGCDPDEFRAATNWPRFSDPVQGAGPNSQEATP
jgi:Helix-turn-helix domain